MRRSVSRSRSQRVSLHLETLEERTVPATITLAGAGRFQDGMVAGLINTGSNQYTALNLRSAIVGASQLAGNNTILLDAGTYAMSSVLGQFIVSNTSGTLTIQAKAGGSATINAQGISRIFLNQSGLALSGLVLENGLAADRGGAIFNNGTLNVSNCQFLNNEARGGSDGSPVEGGAIFNMSNRILDVVNCTFVGNIAHGGTTSALLGGTANGEGGAIFFAGGTALLSDNVLNSTFTGNKAIGGNGTLFQGLGAPGGIGAGGGIFAQAGNYDLNILNATFAANVAQGGNGVIGDGGNATGGAIFFENGGLGTTRVVNDTIAFNKAAGGAGAGALASAGKGSGGGIASGRLAGNFLALPVPKVINTIIAKNTATQSGDVDGLFSSLGSNLVGDNTGAAASFSGATKDFVGSTSAPLDPSLDPLGNYGGPTQTFRLKTGSFAIDRGNSAVVTGPLNLTFDERGQARRSGIAVDIGAYEVVQAGQNKTYLLAQGATLTTTSANGLLAGLGNPLHQTVSVRLAPGGAPATGTLTLRADGTFSYKPPLSFSGTVTFHFQVVVDGQATDTFTVTITVQKNLGRI